MKHQSTSAALPRTTRNISALITWVANPTPRAADIEGILGMLSLDDLAYTMLNVEGIPGRLAWLEWGRRKKFADLSLGLSVSEGNVAITFEGEGPVLHGLALFVEDEG